MPLRESFSFNLRRLCANERSIAHVCRRLEINRQQFNTYLSGRNLPNETIVQKIIDYFDIDISEMFAGRGTHDVLHSTNPVELGCVGRVMGDHDTPSLVCPGYYRVYYKMPDDDTALVQSLLIVTATPNGSRFVRITRTMHSANNGRPFWRHYGVVREFEQIAYFAGIQRKGQPFPSLHAVRSIEYGLASHIGSGFVRVGSNLASVALCLVPSRETSVLGEIKQCGRVVIDTTAERRSAAQLLNRQPLSAVVI